MKKSNSTELTHHFIETRNMLAQAEEQINSVATPIINTSQQFQKTSQIYSGQKSTLQKSDFFLSRLTKQHNFNIAIVYGSFFFFLVVVGFIVLRRLFYRNFYSDISQLIRQNIQYIFQNISYIFSYGQKVQQDL
ncbi:unnamed protein product [Paramecium octaurelia]|uniref:Sec20 C-terminal domain-containing protein n=1 Tax=Paramecium octaurelia TaxID=43137 RepID=A0A8S1Y556_PAROT|nr:unnamed protein product [Paramecium octaurelia]